MTELNINTESLLMMKLNRGLTEMSVAKTKYRKEKGSCTNKFFAIVSPEFSDWLQEACGIIGVDKKDILIPEQIDNYIMKVYGVEVYVSNNVYDGSMFFGGERELKCLGITKDNKVQFKDVMEMKGSLEYKYAIIEDTTTTVCKAVLPNGFTVGTGESACVDPDNFDEELGRKFARERAESDAENELWKLEGYLLKVTGKVSKDYQ